MVVDLVFFIDVDLIDIHSIGIVFSKTFKINCLKEMYCFFLMQILVSREQ